MSRSRRRCACSSRSIVDLNKVGAVATAVKEKQVERGMNGGQSQ